MDTNLIQTTSDWQEKINQLQSILDELRPKLIEAEARLTENISLIGAFEFKLRAQIGPLVERLERLQQEIQEFRNQFRRLQDDWFFAQDSDILQDWDPTDWQFGADASATAEGAYRYMGPQIQPPPSEVSKDTQEAMKRLYRQLARRFHPDLATNEEDRAYCTQMMMKINAAYAAGDLTLLQKIVLEPDSITHLETTQTDQQLAEALMREVARCQRRLNEIEEELARLAQHRNTQLLEKAQRLEAKGIDFLQVLTKELQEKIAQKLVERDVLSQQIEAFGEDEANFASNDFADTIYDLNLEQVFEYDPDIEAENWSWRRRDRVYEDDEWDELD